MGVACCADAVVDENDEMNYNLILMTNDKKPWTSYFSFSLYFVAYLIHSNYVFL